MQTEITFESNGRRLRMTRLTAMKQFHLTRRIAPLLPPLVPVIQKIAAEAEADKAAKAAGAKAEEEAGNAVLAASLAQLAEPFALALQQMSDEDGEAVFDITLGSVKVETSPGVWVQLWVPGAKTAAVIEMNDLSQLMPIVLRVVQENLGNFMPGFPTSRVAEPSPALSGEPSPAKKIG